MTHPTDAAIAQANKALKLAGLLDAIASGCIAPDYRPVITAAELREWADTIRAAVTPARELDAEKGGELGRCCYGGMKPKSDCASCAAWAANPPAQAAEAVLPNLRKGALVTLTADDYPGLGEYFVQLRTGPTSDDVAIRVYGATVAEVSKRADFILNKLQGG